MQDKSTEDVSQPQEQTKKRQRAVQQRAVQTRERILETAIELFATRGYEGVAARNIETTAQVKRGLVAYHFGTKEDLWRASVDFLFAQMPPVSRDTERALQDLPIEAQIRAQITLFVQFSARYPAVSRIIIQEGRSPTWRLDYLVENYVRPRVSWIDKIVGGGLNPHGLYAFIGAATLVFDVGAECRSLFGVDPYDEAFVREHAKVVCDMVLGNNLLAIAPTDPGASG
ncbi:MAG: TetR/AcrR family transcriptional regulator [Pseudomonadota bacterium]